MTDPNLYKTIIEGMHEGVYFVDPERRITFWNRGAERITGFTADDVMNRGCQDNILVHIDAEGNRLCTERCPLVAVMQGQSGHSVDHLFLHHKDGQRIPVTVSISAIRDEQGRPRGVPGRHPLCERRAVPRNRPEALPPGGKYLCDAPG